MPGALSDIRVIEFAGIGAAPFGAMMLARRWRPRAGGRHSICQLRARIGRP
jgi:hypothetical protein